MSQDGANLPQDVQEVHDNTATTNNNTPEGSTKMDNSNSSSNSIKSSKKNAMSKQASPTMDGESTGGSQSKSASIGGDQVIKDVIGGSSKRASNDKGKCATTMEHELHIWTERERRKKMKDMFSSLHALLPQLPNKTDKASIVGEAINYIKTLQGTLQKLERIKQERMRAQHSVGGASTSAPPRPEPAAVPATTREATLADLVSGWNAQHAAGARGVGTAGLPPGAVIAPPPFRTWSGPNVVLNMAGDDAFITLSTPRQRDIFTTVLFVLEKHRIDVVTANVSSDQNRSLFNLHVRVNAAFNQVSGSMTPEEKYKLAVSEMMLWLSN